MTEGTVDPAALLASYLDGRIKLWVTHRGLVHRREHRALQLYTNLRFHGADDPHVLFYDKRTPDGSDHVLVAVNMDPFATHTSLVDVPLDALGIAPDQPYRMRELLTGQVWEWRGPRGYVELDPQREPAQIFHLVP